MIETADLAATAMPKSYAESMPGFGVILRAEGIPPLPGARHEHLLWLPTNRRVKNDVRDAADLADLLRMGRLPEAWIAPPETRELRELVRYRAKLVAIRSGLKAQIHAVLAKAGVLIAVSDLFGVTGRQRLAKVPLGPAYAERIRSLLELIDILDSHQALGRRC